MAGANLSGCFVRIESIRARSESFALIRPSGAFKAAAAGNLSRQRMSTGFGGRNGNL